jgi:flagellar hook-basal body complex protein FliE
MVNSVGSGGSFARDAIRAAMQRQAELQSRLQEAASDLRGEGAQGAERSSFEASLTEGLEQINTQVEAGDRLVDGIVSGKVTEFHEVASQIKQADLTFKFALSVRNKFIDAYREVMRMSV